MTLNLPVKRYAKDHFFCIQMSILPLPLFLVVLKSVCVSVDLSDMRKTTDDGILFMSQYKDDYQHK